jgi:DNA-binding transcriptional LysR family regulator
LHPDELATHRLIANSASPALNRWPWSAHANQPKGEAYLARGHTRSDNSAILLTLALRGVGIARLNDLLSQPHIDSGDLVPVLDGWFDRSRLPIYAVMLQERHRLPKLRACIDHWAQWLAGPAA